MTQSVLNRNIKKSIYINRFLYSNDIQVNKIGFIQLTGKQNYTKFANSIGKSIDETIAYLETDEGAIESALFYWKVANCNKHCDSGDQKALCKSINGGFNGLEDRIAKYNKFIDILL